MSIQDIRVRASVQTCPLTLQAEPDPEALIQPSQNPHPNPESRICAREARGYNTTRGASAVLAGWSLWVGVSRLGSLGWGLRVRVSGLGSPG